MADTAPGIASPASVADVPEALDAPSTTDRSLVQRAVRKVESLVGYSTQPPSLEVSVSNETRARLEIQNGGSTLILAPLERRSLPQLTCATLQSELERLELLGYVSVSETSQDQLRRHQTWKRTERAVYLAGFFYGGLAFFLWGLFVGTSPWYWTVLAVVLAAIAVVRLRDADVGVRVVQTVYLLIVVVVGIGMPVLAVWAGGNIDDRWNDAFSGSTPEQQDFGVLMLLGRSIQTVFIIVVTLLPGLLYFLFDRYRLSTLREEFTKQIFRLDTSVRTRGDVHAAYGHLMDEAYGSDPRREGSNRQQPGTRLPIVIATVVFALGWIVVLLNSEAGTGEIRTSDFRTLMVPWQSATAFAFLGAYVFVLQAALRAYLRGDLRPKFYSYAVLRVVVAVVFAWVLELIFGLDGEGISASSDFETTLLLVVAFAVGLVPDTLLLRLREVLRGNGFFFPDLTERHPLTDLEGIDIYDRTRLEQEGVTNVEALAHSNLVELMLQTRIPPGRLVDWTDQAQLYIHLQEVSEGKQDSKNEQKLHRKQNKLRSRGIRTASDLLVAADAAKCEPKRTALLGTLGTEDGCPLLETLIDAIRDDEWMRQIRDWHDPANRTERTLRYPTDFMQPDHPDPIRSRENGRTDPGKTEATPAQSH
jgi:hypothetical protein